MDDSKYAKLVMISIEMLSHDSILLMGLCLANLAPKTAKKGIIGLHQALSGLKQSVVVRFG